MVGTCCVCQSVSALTEPHVEWGALAIVGIALALLFWGAAKKHAQVLLVAIALFAGGIAVDVVAHGYDH